MRLIHSAQIGTNTLSIVDVAGRKKGKWGIARIIRIVETHGQFTGLNRSNVVHQYFCISYDARSQKAFTGALNEAMEQFNDALRDEPGRVEY